jgi:O-antigen ligase
MIAILAMALTLVCGIRWPGVLLAGCLFTYQADALSGIEDLGMGYVAIAAVIAIARFSMSKDQFRFHGTDFAMILLVVWALLSTFYAPLPGPAFDYFLRLLMSVGGMYAVGRLMIRNPDDTLYEMLVATVILGTVMSLLLATSDQSFVQYGRLRLGEESTVGLAHPLPYALVSAFLLFLLGRKLWEQGIAMVAMGAVFYTAILSGTRSVFLAAALAIIIALPYMWRWVRFGTMGKAAMLGIAAFLAGPLYFSRDLLPSLERLTINFTGGGLDLYDRSSVERGYAWEYAKNMIGDSPLFGHGHGSFAQLTPFPYPHNMIAETGAELGLIGLVIMALWLWLLAKAVFTIRKVWRFASVVIVALSVAAFWQMMLSFAFFMGRPLFLLTAVAAAVAPFAATYYQPVRRRGNPAALITEPVATGSS